MSWLLFSGDLLDRDLRAALRRVGGDERKLVLAPDHVGCVRMRPLEVDRVEITAGRAESAADAAVLVDLGGTAAEASCRLCLHLLLGEGQAEIVEGLRGDTGLFARDLALRVVEGLHVDIILVELLEEAEVTVSGSAV